LNEREKCVGRKEEMREGRKVDGKENRKETESEKY
jgi:hypothetical protein